MIDFFDPAYAHPMEIFSTQHLIALVFFIAFVLLLFFCRKLFIKYRVLDIIFRYTLVAVMLFIELYIMYKNGNGFYSIIGDKFLSPRALCSHMLWFTAIALLANSDRLMKLIYPIAIIGASMSLLFIDMGSSFPHYRAFQFFITHECFFIGALYFVFTRKINHYDFKDFINSIAFLVGMGIISIALSYGSNSDPYFIFKAPGPLGFITETLGQVGYTLLYILLILIVELIIYGITHLCTRKRPNDIQNYAKVNDTKFMQKLSKLTNRQKIICLLLAVGLGVINSALLSKTCSIVLGVIDIILTIFIICSFVLFEIIANYQRQQKLLVECKIENDDTTSNNSKIEKHNKEITELIIQQNENNKNNNIQDDK